MISSGRGVCARPARRFAGKMIARGGGESFRFLFLFVNATLIVIISARQRPSDAAVIVTAGNTPKQHHQQQQQQQQQASGNKPAQQHQVIKATSERNTVRHAASKTTSGQSERLTAPGSAHDTNALAYLQRYGYMQAPTAGDASNNLISEESFSNAIADFQRFAGLPETGHVDNQTLGMMQTPRCGNTDKPAAATVSKSGQLMDRSWMLAPVGEPAAALKRRKRYALQGSKWRRQELTYRISQYPTKFAGRRHEVDSQIERAFGIWSQVAPIDFIVKKEGRVHIDIRFASGDHGDGDAFDGPGNTLAHAYFPQYGGDAHFDDQEYWTVDSYAGTNIFQVAAHELGHSLGLGHSNVREALMAPFYQKYKPNFKLHIDDVLAIQALYGEKAFLPEVPGGDHGSGLPTTTAATTTTTTTTTTTSTTTTTAAPPSPGLFGGGGGPRSPPIYKGNRRPFLGDDPDEQQPRHDQEGENGNPDLSSNGINGFGGSAAPDEPTSGPADLCADSMIDTVTRTEDGNSYVFKGEHYWLVTNEGLARGYPRRISADWEGLPSNLDAALTWADGKTFFFKGNKYWRFRNRQRDLGYPKLISAGFAGIPDDIDAAFVWSGNGRTYFFKGADYWRFDSKAEPPVSSEYPRSIKVWMGVPAHINAAFKWDNNVTYFFKGNQYYRFNDREFKVESRGRPPFPRQTSEWWFGCVSSNLPQRAQPSQMRNFLLSGDPSRQQLSQHTSRTARLHPNPNQRTATAALQSAPASASHPDQGDWSFLAGLNADQTRQMGTHISDHQKPPSSLAPEKRWREEETLSSEQDIDRRLGPVASNSGEPMFILNGDEPQSLEPGRRRPTPTAISLDQSAGRHKTTGYAMNMPPTAASGPSYQTSSATTAILSNMTHRHAEQASWIDSLVIVRWLSVACSGAVIWLSTQHANRHTMRSSGKGFGHAR